MKTLALPGRTNAAIADRLAEVAALLAEQHANPHRVTAYRRAAAVVRGHDRELAEVYAIGGLEALQALPGIGESLARSIRNLLLHGRLPMLERLRGETDPVLLFQSVPGIGPVLAGAIHRRLDIDSLEELELAARDGTLATVSGIGSRRLAGIRAALNERLARVRRAPAPSPVEPPVEELLDVDREYRAKAEMGALRTIAPRRMNPRHESWLPVLHTTRGPRHYTALYSNTPRAHEMRATRDWVVLYYDHDGSGGERQCTVITARFGALSGHRIVRGREAECMRLLLRRQWEDAVAGVPRQSA
jgi:Holliday junction resolvasome RuvABC DNA-binding subunit